MKKKKGIGIALLAGVLLAVSALASSRSNDCNIVCPVCCGTDVIHFQKRDTIRYLCRDCGYEWERIIVEE